MIIFSPWRQNNDPNHLVPVPEAVQFVGHESNVRACAWHPRDAGRLASVDTTTLRMWDVNAASHTASSTATAVLGSSGSVNALQWNPHQGAAVVAACHGPRLTAWDTRTMTEAFAIDNAHLHAARDLDFNPNKPYVLASCGDDGRVKFWDTRNVRGPVLEYGTHTHWAWTVRFNPLQDQLLLTSASDARVHLTNVASLASSLYTHVDGESLGSHESAPEPIPDGLLAEFDEHEDSVYAVAWSTIDPWVFASLSYDGRFVINRVPNDIKFKILL